MKRLSIVMSVFIALAVAAPSFAVEFDATGSLRFQGVYNDKASSNKDDRADSFRDMRLRVRTELKVTDKLTLVTRFDALDKVLSSNDSAIDAGEDDDNIDFDRAYVKIVSPIGLFVIGRQEGITWGTSFADDEDDTDRIKYVLPIPVGEDKLYIAAVAEKVTEVDKGYTKSDKDNDKYYLSATYVAEKFRSGFLVGFYDFRTFQDPGQAVVTKAYNEALDTLNTTKTTLNSSGFATEYATQMATAQAYADAAAAAAAAGDAATAASMAALAASTQAGAEGVANTNTDAAIDAAELAFATAALPAMSKFATYGKTAAGKVWLLSPYVTGKFDDLGISAELDYVTGSISYDTAADDKDVAAYSFFLETTYEAGPMGFQIGFATVSGDTDYTDNDIGSMGYVSPGADWGKMFILSGSGSPNDGSTHGMNTSLGNGLGNHVGDGFGTAYTTLLAGYQMFYLGADFDLNEKMNIATVMCMSKADDAPTGYDDDQGYEIDLKFSWKIMENLEYCSTAAYLATGDYWDAGTTVDAEDTIALYHKLELTF